MPNRKSAPVPRRPQVLAVEVHLPGSRDGFAALVQRVRPDGLFLSTFRELPVGASVVLELELEGTPMTIDAVVAERDERVPGVRLTFEALTDEARRRIEALRTPPALSLVQLASKVA